MSAEIVGLIGSVGVVLGGFGHLHLCHRDHLWPMIWGVSGIVMSVGWLMQLAGVR